MFISKTGKALLIKLNGGLAQLGEHLLCKQGVIGSIPIGSTMVVRRVKYQHTKDF